MSVGKERLEAFSDGVVAIIITIMVLELHVPEGAALSDLRPVLPTFLSYLLSFIYVGIYWNNHHHMLKATRSISAPVMWANMHFLFWLSMTPFATAWLGDHPEAAGPTALYGGALLMNAIAYNILARLLVHHEGPESTLARAFGRTLLADLKGFGSALLYVFAIGLAFVEPLASKAIYILVAAIWFIPDRRIERVLKVRPAP